MLQKHTKFSAIFAFLFFVLQVHPSILLSQRAGDLQQRVISLAPSITDAVIPISAWSDTDWSKPDSVKFAQVVGSGFIVDRNGHFVTAAHVVGTKTISGVAVRLTATIRQKSGDGSAQSFKILEIDTDHDLALCQIDAFKVFTPSQSPTAKSIKNNPIPVDATHPFASLKIAKSIPLVGEFILVGGFPLGSWTPTLQFGILSAAWTIYPNPPPAPPMGVPKDSRQLLQISVSANHGNSGGPVVDLSTGEVLGVILQIVPAPLAVGGLRYDANTFDMSGLVLAAPATWVNSLLVKNHVQSEAVRSGKLVIW